MQCAVPGCAAFQQRQHGQQGQQGNENVAVPGVDPNAVNSAGGDAVSAGDGGLKRGVGGQDS